MSRFSEKDALGARVGSDPEYTVLYSKAQLARFRQNELSIWNLSLDSLIRPFRDRREHESTAILLGNDLLVLFDYQFDSDREVESFILVDVNHNVVLNRVSFRDSERRGVDIFNSYCVDSLGRVFFATKLHMGGNGRTSKLYYLDIFDADAKDHANVHLLHEDPEEILYIALSSSSPSRCPLTPGGVEISYITQHFEVKNIRIEFDARDRRKLGQLVSVETFNFEKSARTVDTRLDAKAGALEQVSAQTLQTTPSRKSKGRFYAKGFRCSARRWSRTLSGSSRASPGTEIQCLRCWLKSRSPETRPKSAFC